MGDQFKKERLDKVLVHLGVGSRKEIKQLVRRAEIAVNKLIVKDSSEKIDPYHDLIEVKGQAMRYQKNIYIMLNKPSGVLSATEDRQQRTVLDLLPPELRAFKPFPVGRLDKDTVGLLLLSNDGILAHELLSPKKHVAKTYIAWLERPITEREVKKFAAGVVLDDGYVCLPAFLEAAAPLKDSQQSQGYPVEVTITEGKFHQIKRMFLAVDNRVKQLKRTRMGTLLLDEALKPGQYRLLTEEELASLIRNGRSGQQ